jgi:peptide/nickel transport system permease protein
LPPLLTLVLQRTAIGILTLVAVSVLIFIGTELLPGDVAQAILGQNATPEAVANIRKSLGLDRPIHIRYLEWIGGFVRGDLGRSLASELPVAELIAGRLANTLVLAAAAAVVAVPLSVLLGLIAALYRERFVDRAISATTLLFVSVPEFLIGYALVVVFAVQLGWLPALAQARDGMSVAAWFRALALPVTVLTLVVTAHTMRLARTAIVAVLGSDYIQMAEIKGLTPARIIVVHAFPNALSPILSIVMLTLAYLVVGVVVVEVVFNYAGMGKLMVDAVTNRDVPLVQACGLIFSGVYVVLNFLADFLSILANPRLRHPK